MLKVITALCHVGVYSSMHKRARRSQRQLRLSPPLFRVRTVCGAQCATFSRRSVRSMSRPELGAVGLRVCLTTRGFPCLQLGPFRYRRLRMMATGEVVWRCTVKSCVCIVRTDPSVSTVVHCHGLHMHRPTGIESHSFLNNEHRSFLLSSKTNVCSAVVPQG